MELDKIEILLEKYFQAETTKAEEQKLRRYFSSDKVAQHLEQYRSLFCYFEQAKAYKTDSKLVLPSENTFNKFNLSIAAAVLILLGVGVYNWKLSEADEPKKIAEINDPKVAFRETQKALALLSEHLNTGIESVQYLDNYQQSKNKIFKK
jgi:hypothetical protein